jgi:ribosomal protein L11 methylase PrmA
VIASALPSSFRDPSGFLFIRDGVLFRQINLSFREQFDAFVDSGLCRALTDAGLLIPHEEVDLALAAAPGAYKVIRPEPIDFVSYPYEWCFGELKDAALATLQIQAKALDFGMSLRDASAYNIQFHHGKPILVDTLSFATLREGTPWVAYRQFCQHFLAPLALASHKDVRLSQLSRVHIDGIPLDLAASLLPFRARLRPSLLLHVFLHARSQRRYQDRQPTAPRRPFPLRAFRGLVGSLQKALASLRWEPDRSAWTGYYTEAKSYTPEATEHKVAVVARFIDRAEPQSVWDLGGNTGLYSRIAAARGTPTISLDQDPAAVEANYRQASTSAETNLLPLVLDLTNPSPGIGWANRERLSLSERGPADLVMALALIHHLAIGNNTPLEWVAGLMRDLCTWLVIEFVPKSDPMVQRLLATREDVFPGYTLEGFEAAFAQGFSIEEREPIQGSERVLYLMRARSRDLT